MSDRALAPAVGVALLVAITTILATAVAAGVVVESPEPPAPPASTTFDASADATGEIRVVHTGGEAIDPDALGLHVSVDGTPLEAQPPVPFFSASGFVSGPTGPFNSATGGEWRAGEEASLRLASSNDPMLSAGATVTVRIYVDDSLVAALEITVQAASTGSSPSVPPPVDSRSVSRSPSPSAPVSGT